MTSEIRVNKIENRSGLGTVTFADTGVDLAGIVTATTFSGSGASLTALPAGNLTGTVADARLTTVSSSKLSGALPALDGSALTGVASTENIRTNTNATFLQNVNVSGSTTTGTTIVGGGVTISESGIEASGIGITCANINGTQIGGRRNLIINGDMQVAQRGTSNNSSSGGFTCDRFGVYPSGLDEAPTQTQHTLTSSDTGPYAEGLRHSLHIQNGNQTSVGTADNLRILYKVEAQDLSKSGWNYTSASSFITLSFWVKSSVAQNFYVQFRTRDTPEYNYTIETGSLTADTWTKVIKTIPGNSNLVFNNDTGVGTEINFWQFLGTDSTGSMTLNQWGAYSGSARTPDMTNTWYDTNNATFEITGVQLEVGPQATPFEHRSFADELRLCQRYFHAIINQGWSTAGYNGSYLALGVYLGASKMAGYWYHPVPMRANPTLIQGTATGGWNIYRADGGDVFNNLGGIITNSAAHMHGKEFTLTEVGSNVSSTGGYAGIISVSSDDAWVQFSSEL